MSMDRSEDYKKVVLFLAKNIGKEIGSQLKIPSQAVSVLVREKCITKAKGGTRTVLSNAGTMTPEVLMEEVRKGWRNHKGNSRSTSPRTPKPSAEPSSNQDVLNAIGMVGEKLDSLEFRIAAIESVMFRLVTRKAKGGEI